MRLGDALKEIAIKAFGWVSIIIGIALMPWIIYNVIKGFIHPIRLLDGALWSWLLVYGGLMGIGVIKLNKDHYKSFYRNYKLPNVFEFVIVFFGGIILYLLILVLFPFRKHVRQGKVFKSLSKPALFIFPPKDMYEPLLGLTIPDFNEGTKCAGIFVIKYPVDYVYVELTLNCIDRVSKRTIAGNIELELELLEGHKTIVSRHINFYNDSMPEGVRYKIPDGVGGVPIIIERFAISDKFPLHHKITLRIKVRSSTWEVARKLGSSKIQVYYEVPSK